MILLQAQLFYFFLKISITAFIQNRNSIFACYFPIFIAREHIQMTISMGNAKASVVINTRFTRDSFFVVILITPEACTRTVLRCF